MLNDGLNNVNSTIVTPTTPTTTTRPHNSSPTNTMSSGGDQSKVEQVPKLTKWLCMIILALVVVVLILLIVDLSPNVFDPNERHLRGRAQNASSMRNMGSNLNNLYLSDRTLSSSAEQAGRLLASSSDDHYTSTDQNSDPEHHFDTSLDDGSDDNTGNGDRNNNNGRNGNGESRDEDPNNQDLGGNSNSNLVLKDLADINNNNNNDNKNNNRRPTGGLRLHNAGSPLGNRANPSKVLRDPPPENVCMTPGCVRAAAQVLASMDPQTKPCDDFYQFACGRWISTQVIPDEKTSLSVFSQNTADLNIKLRALIERSPRAEDPPIVGQMRNMYASCMNLTDIEQRGDQPLLEALEYFGGWPVLSHRTLDGPNGNQISEMPSNEPQTITATRRRRNNNQRRIARASVGPSVEHWLDILIKFRQRGFSHDMIIDLSVVPDVRNNKRYIIELDQSSLGLPDRAYYFKGMNDTTVSAYYNLMCESAVLLGAPRDEARKQMLEALEFETSLAKISAPREQRRNVTRMYNKMPARDLYKLAPNIDWLRYLRSLLRDDMLDLDEDQVIVKVPSFLQSIDTLLVKTEPRIVANYMLWRVVRHSMSGLTRKWRELAHSYSTVTTGRQVEEPRWEQCLGSLDGTLGTALSAFYVKNHFNERSKATALEMVHYIRSEFLKILNEIDWMDEETREEARSKANAISAYIGYPDELLQDELVEELYSGVKMARTNFYQNVRNLRVWSTDYAFGQLRKPNKRGDWKKHARAAVVNAYYNSLENSIEFPAGILQGAFFDAERPNYMNFGAIGYVIGHEITHGFDDRGRQFDRDGNDRNWWKPKTDARFRERAQCIIEQYGNFTVAENGLRVNGVNTQGENIADNGGIKQAFRAYRRWTKDNGREQRLPGLAQYTPDQLFWISAANIWCGKFRPEVLKLRVNSGVHSPARFRIIGPLSNSPEFVQSFGCPLGSPMNPEKKCSVW